jgi:hypothetical protein
VTDFQTPESIATRLRDQFAPAYLTLTSIIQGVALSALVVRIEATGERFDLANWLLAAATLLAFLLVWHEYLMQALAYVWLPTLLDSAVPFAFLVAELFMAHFVYGNERAWLFAAGVAYIIGLAAYAVRRTQTYRHQQENAGVVRAITDFAGPRLAFSIVPAVLYLAAWALYDVLGLGQATAVVAALAVVVVIIVILGTIPYWQRVLAYARSARPANR